MDNYADVYCLSDLLESYEEDYPCECDEPAPLDDPREPAVATHWDYRENAYLPGPADEAEPLFICIQTAERQPDTGDGGFPNPFE